MPRGKKTNKQTEAKSYNHGEEHPQRPDIGTEPHFKKKKPPVTYRYDSSLSPELDWDENPAREEAEALIKQILEAEDLETAKVAARKLKAMSEPFLNWTGKAERLSFEVPTLPLFVHERLSTRAIIETLKSHKLEKAEQLNLFDLFNDPKWSITDQILRAYEYHDKWVNRMILGDSLVTMNSLLQYEGMGGKVQMIYIDPPYGVKFGSNFQPFVRKRVVEHNDDEDFTREPEMVQAYRDTWELGLHSYLSYLRDRLLLARELLTDSGSVFVQISDENVHHVRELMDEVFGEENFISLIPFRKKTMPLGTIYLEQMSDFILWYGKETYDQSGKAKTKYQKLYLDRSVEGEFHHCWYELADNSRHRMSIHQLYNHSLLPSGARVYRLKSLEPSGIMPSGMFEYEFEGKVFKPPKNGWATTLEGMKSLEKARRLQPEGNRLTFIIYADESSATQLTAPWTDTVGANDKSYVVQTNTKVIERCLLMTTDPGDLVLDITCGSGTTAYVAEQWGRRWITCDSSRVALVLAKHRLMTAKFDYHVLRPLNAEDVARNPNGIWLTDPSGAISGKATFQCKTVPHITLKSIARNASLDPIFAKHEPILVAELEKLNREVVRVGAPLKETLVEKLIAKHREQGANAVTDADTRRWLLPDTQPGLIKTFPARSPLKGVTPKQAESYRSAIPKREWQEWEVPFDTDPGWPKALQDALTAYRAAWRAKMDEVNACIAANAEMEELVNKPESVKGVVRVTGPFTMEGVIAVEDGPDTPIGGAPEELDTFDGDVAVTNAEAHLDKILRLIRASGVDFPGNKNMKFSRLDPLSGASLIHAEGEWVNGDGKERRVAVSVGPEVGNVSAMQVEDVIRDATRKGYDDVVFAGFGFDAAAQDAIESGSHPKLRLHMALIRPDVAMGDLLKTQPGSQLFTVFSAPRIKPPVQRTDGEYVIEVEGMDVYDPVSNTLFPTSKDRIAAWFLDTDYDGRTFCICQAFFPDKSKWSKLAKALGDVGVVEEDAFEALSGLTSLPFPRPARLAKDETWRVAVKVIDPRGNEGMRVVQMSGRY
jgi:adenine-specific DNA-methyltransferase